MFTPYPDSNQHCPDPRPCLSENTFSAPSRDISCHPLMEAWNNFLKNESGFTEGSQKGMRVQVGAFLRDLAEKKLPDGYVHSNELAALKAPAESLERLPATLTSLLRTGAVPYANQYLAERADNASSTNLMGKASRLRRFVKWLNNEGLSSENSSEIVTPGRQILGSELAIVQSWLKSMEKKGKGDDYRKALAGHVGIFIKSVAEESGIELNLAREKKAFLALRQKKALPSGSVTGLICSDRTGEIFTRYLEKISTQRTSQSSHILTAIRAFSGWLFENNLSGFYGKKVANPAVSPSVLRLPILSLWEDELKRENKGVEYRRALLRYVRSALRYAMKQSGVDYSPSHETSVFAEFNSLATLKPGSLMHLICTDGAPGLINSWLRDPQESPNHKVIVIKASAVRRFAEWMASRGYCSYRPEEIVTPSAPGASERKVKTTPASGAEKKVLASKPEGTKRKRDNLTEVPRPAQTKPPTPSTRLTSSTSSSDAAKAENKPPQGEFSIKPKSRATIALARNGPPAAADLHNKEAHTSNIQPPKPQEVTRREPIDAAFDYSRFIAARNSAINALIAGGMSFSQIKTLKNGNVDLIAGLISVKDGNMKLIELDEASKIKVSYYQEERGRSAGLAERMAKLAGPFFVANDGGTITVDESFPDDNKKVIERIKRLESVRDTTITLLIKERGFGIEQIAELEAPLLLREAGQEAYLNLNGERLLISAGDQSLYSLLREYDEFTRNIEPLRIMSREFGATPHFFRSNDGAKLLADD